MSHTVSTYESLDRKSTFHPINQEINKDVQSWCDSISEGGTIMHRQTGLSRVFFNIFLFVSFLGSQSSDSLYNDGPTARAIMLNRMLFWKVVSPR